MMRMSEVISRPLLFGLGVVALTADKVRQAIDQAVARGEVSKEESRTLLDNLKQRADEEKRNLEARVKEQVRKALQNAGLAAKTEVEILRARVDALEGRLARVEAGPSAESESAEAEEGPPSPEERSEPAV
ncbi:MAG: phasin family protein [Armatimonadota bacterium]